MLLNDSAIRHVLDVLRLVLHGYFVEGAGRLLELVDRKGRILPNVVLALVLARAWQVELLSRRFLVLNVTQPHPLQVVLVTVHSATTELFGLHFVLSLLVSSPKCFIFNEFVLLVPKLTQHF